MVTGHVSAVCLPTGDAVGRVALAVRREESWKDAELLLRHQLVVLRRQPRARPKPSWADRALIAAPLGVIPRTRRAKRGMMVTPDTVLRWHRDIVRRRWAAKSRRKRPAPGNPPQYLRPGTSPGARESGLGLPQEHGELAGLGIRIAPTTVWGDDEKAGLDPAPRRTGPTWGSSCAPRQ